MNKTANQVVFASTDWNPEASSDAPHPEDCRCETCVAACDKRPTVPMIRVADTIPSPEPTDVNATDDSRFADLDECDDECDERHQPNCHCVDCAESQDSHERDDDWDFPDDDSPYDATVEYTFLDSSRLTTLNFSTLGDVLRSKQKAPKHRDTNQRRSQTVRAEFHELYQRRELDIDDAIEELRCDRELDEDIVYACDCADGHEIQEALLSQARHQQQETQTLRNRRDNRRKAHEAHVATRRARLKKEGKLQTTAPGTRLASDSRFNEEGRDGKRFKKLTERTLRRESASPRYLNARKAA